MARFPFLSLLALSTTAASIATPRGNTGPPNTPQCRQTKVAILGGGLAGVTAAQALHNASISDFLILEYNNALGGRMVHTTFGKDSSGNPYVVELGANWVQGLGTPGGPENPIWTLAKKWGIENTYSDYANISSFNAGGAADFVGKIAQFYDAYDVTEKDAGTMWALNQQDRSERAGLTAAGWRPAKDMEAQAAEWWGWDWEYAFTPGESSQEFGVIVGFFFLFLYPCPFLFPSKFFRWRDRAIFHMTFISCGSEKGIKVRELEKEC
jgi:polyamine oxidase